VAIQIVDRARPMPRAGAAGWAWSGIGTLILLALAIYLIPLSDRQSASAPPVLIKAGAWQWVGAGPGGNMFIASETLQKNGRYASAWFAQRDFATIASIQRDSLERLEFDCEDSLQRRIEQARIVQSSGRPDHYVIAAARSEWRRVQGHSMHQKLWVAACGPHRQGIVESKNTGR